MITLYLMGKMLGWMFKLMIWMIMLPFQIILAPLRGFRSGASKKPRYRDDIFYW